MANGKNKKNKQLPPKNPKKKKGNGGGLYATPDNGFNPGATRDRYNDLIDRGVDASDSDRLRVGDDYTARTLGGTNFGGTNDYLHGLWGDLGGANFDEGINYLKNFLGPNGGGGGTATAGAAGGRGGGSGYTRSASGVLQGGPSSGGGQIPDTMAQGGWVSDRIRELWDPSHLDPMNDPTVAPLLRALSEESLAQTAKARGQVDAHAEGQGRYGSGLYRSMQDDVTGTAAKAHEGSIAALMHGVREGALGRRMEGLGTANQRDLAAMNDRTQRYGIDSAASASRASSSEGADVARRGQDLAAINSMLGMHQFGLSAKQGIGNMFTQAQQGALGNIPGMQNASNGGLQIGLGGANGLAGLDLGLGGLDLGRFQSSNALAGQRAGVNLQRYMYDDQAPQRNLDNLLRTIMGVGGMGGSQWGQGPPPSSLSLQALLAGIGGGGGQ